MLSNEMVLVFAVIAIVVLLIIVLFMSYFHTLLAISSFAYTNARLKALRTPFIFKREAEQLGECSTLSEALSFLTSYGYHISPQESYENTEMVLERHYASALRTLISMVPLGAKPFFETYALKFELKQIKNVLRAKYAGVEEEVKEALHTFRGVTQEMLEEMMEAKSMGEVLAVIKNTPYAAALETVEEGAPLPIIEAAIDRYFLKQLTSSLSRVDNTLAAPFKEFVGRYIDILNLKHLWRAKQEGISTDVLRHLPLGSGRELADWKISQMAEAEDTSELLREMEGTSYFAFIKSKEKGIDIELDRAILRYAFQISSMYSLYAGPSIKYLISKEMEIRNIKTILRAIKENIPYKEIEPLLVVEE